MKCEYQQQRPREDAGRGWLVIISIHTEPRWAEMPFRKQKPITSKAAEEAILQIRRGPKLLLTSPMA